MGVLDRQTAENDSRFVRALRIVVHNSGQPIPGSTFVENHWTIYLILQGDQGSVQINMRKTSYEDPLGMLILSDHRYEVSNTAICYWDFPVTQNARVMDFVRVVYYWGRERFWFSGGCCGCQCWVLTVIGDFARAGLLQSNAEEVLKPIIELRYDSDRKARTMPWILGEFY